MLSCNLEFQFPPKEKMISSFKVKQIATVPVTIGHWFKQRATIEICFFSSLAALSVELSLFESDALSKWEIDESWAQGRATLS